MRIHSRAAALLPAPALRLQVGCEQPVLLQHKSLQFSADTTGARLASLQILSNCEQQEFAPIRVSLAHVRLTKWLLIVWMNQLFVRIVLLICLSVQLNAP